MFPNLGNNKSLLLLLAIHATGETATVSTNTPILLLAPTLKSKDYEGIVVDSDFKSKGSSVNLNTTSSFKVREIGFNEDGSEKVEEKAISPSKSIEFIRHFLQKTGKVLKEVRVSSDNEAKFLSQAGIKLKIGHVDLEGENLKEIKAEKFDQDDSLDIVFLVNQSIDEYSILEYEIVQDNSVNITLVFE